MTPIEAAELGISPHPGYADQRPGIETTPDAILAARELVERLERLAYLELHPVAPGNAVALLEHHDQAGRLAEQLRIFLLAFEVPA